MNITFLIGNGFDLSFGIDTDYESFLDSYLKIDSPDKDIKEFKNRIIQQRKSQEDDEHSVWADCEKAKGDDTQNYENGNVYLKCWGDFFSELLEYLKMQCSRIDEAGYEEYANEVKRSILDFDKALNLKDGDMIRSHKHYYGSENIDFNFICFNYTECLDRCLESIGTAAIKNWVRVYRYSAQIGNVVHPHGCLSKGNYIFGVNDSSQVANQALLEDPNVEIDLIKHSGNSSCKDYQEDKAIKLISTSDIIVIYGMSIGETDKQWWELVGEWLYTNSERLLVIQQHKNVTSQSPLWMQNMLEREAKHTFFSVANLTDEEISEIESRVLVAFKPAIFQFERLKEKYVC